MKKALILFARVVVSALAIVISLVISFMFVEWLYPEVPENLADLFTCWLMCSFMSGVSLCAIWSRR